MNKAKYYLLTAERISAQEAERVGLVSVVVPADQLMDRALAIADRLAEGSAQGIGWTKRLANHWFRMASPLLDACLAMEMLNFFGGDVQEGLQAMRENGEPRFPSARRRAEEDQTA